MSDAELLRFIDPQTGPITSIISVPYPGFWRRSLWHSRALLSPKFAINPDTLVFQSCGSGWDADKQLSQVKAVTEALERWALHYYQQFPEKAGLDIDPTSTGFAALPERAGWQQVRWNSYCEALERWILNSVWDGGDIELEEIEVTDRIFGEMFGRFGACARLYQVKIDTADLDLSGIEDFRFLYCVLRTREGGALPGSACGVDAASVSSRALAEAYMHLLGLEKLKTEAPSGVTNILEKRVIYWGTDPAGFSRVCGRLKLGRGAVLGKKPDILFSRGLPGPWEPEILVWRTVLKDSPPFLSGGEDRFIV